MNIYLPSSLESMIEIRRLAALENNIMSVGKSQTNYGLNNDSLAGVYVLCQESTILDRKTAIQILSKTNINYNISDFREKSYKGRDIINMILPNGLYHKDKNITITNGKIISGVFSKSNIGTSKGSIINTIFNFYGNKIAIDFIDNIQKMSIEFLIHKGLSVGMYDIYVKPEVRQEFNNNINQSKTNVWDLIYENQKTAKPNSVNMNDLSHSEVQYYKPSESITKLENDIFTELRTIQDKCGKIANGFLEKDVENNVITMFKSGSKGKPYNTAQMAGTVGQQEIFINNQTIRIYRMCNGRSFPKFMRNMVDSESMGLVENSFLSGMTQAEAWAHACTGRVGYIDKGIGTADTGYIQRKLIKSLEGIVLQYDGTVRNSNNNIVQFMTSANNIRTTSIVELPYPTLLMNNSEIRSKYSFSEQEMKKWNISSDENEKQISILIAIRDLMRKKDLVHWQKSTFTNNFDMPFDLDKIFITFKNSKLMTSVTGKLSFDEASKFLEDFVNSKEFSHIVDNNSDDNRLLMKVHDHHNQVMKAFIRTIFCVSEILKSGMDLPALLKVKSYILDKYNESRVSPGDMVGIIAAQSIGEPTTQLNLNSFHSAGVSTGSTSNLSLKRIKELLSLTDSSKMKAPEMKLYFEKKHRSNKEFVSKISNIIKCIYVGDIVNQFNIYYDNNGSVHKNTEETTKPWLFQLSFNKDKVKSINLSIDIIFGAIDLFCNSSLSSSRNTTRNKKFYNVFQDTPNLSMVETDSMYEVNVRFNIKSATQNVLRDMKQIMTTDILITGIDGISGSRVLENKISEIGSDGEIITQTEYLIETDGVNLPTVLDIDGLDATRIECNDFYEIHRIFGIDMLKKQIFNEYRKIITSNEPVSTAHLTLLADFQCHKAQLVNISSKKAGVGSLTLDPLMKASFEESTTNIINSAIYNEVDNMKFASSSVIAGQLSRIGTGMFDMGIDISMIKNTATTSNVKHSMKSIPSGILSVSTPTNNYLNNIKLVV